MNKKITFREIEHTEGLEAHLQQKLDRIESFLKNEPDPVVIEFVLEPHRTHAYNIAELLIKSPNYNVVVKHEGPDMYHVIDHVMHVGYDQLHKEKEKRVKARQTNDSYKSA